MEVADVSNEYLLCMLVSYDRLIPQLSPMLSCANDSNSINAECPLICKYHGRYCTPCFAHVYMLALPSILVVVPNHDIGTILNANIFQNALTYLATCGISQHPYIVIYVQMLSILY